MMSRSGWKSKRGAKVTGIKSIKEINEIRNMEKGLKGLCTQKLEVVS